jgi:glycosyltransferase involved in cell wall biosynthesis
MNQSRLAVVIPAYNEAATIGGVVACARCLGDVIVVDDGSRDDTAMLAREAGAKVLALRGNTGYEGALSAGVHCAIDSNYEFALTMDADGQHGIESAQALVSALGNADIAIGLRLHKQRVSEWLSGLIGALLWGVSDPFSGLKLYRLTSCAALRPFDSHRLVGAEMFVRAHRAGLALVAVPIVTSKRADAPRFDTNWRANVRLARAIVMLTAIHWGILR